MKKQNQSGFELVGVVVVIVLLAVVGFTGYAVWSHNHKAGNSSGTTNVSKVPASIQNKDDLTKAADALSTLSADVNTSLNGASLDTDINSLL